MKLKLFAMMFAVVALAFAGGFAATNTETVDAAAPIYWTECPSGENMKISTATSRKRGGWVVSARFTNVSYAASYRAEAAAMPATASSRIKSTTSAGWMGGGERGSNIYRATYPRSTAKNHKVRVVGLDRNGSIVSCATKVTTKR